MTKSKMIEAWLVKQRTPRSAKEIAARFDCGICVAHTVAKRLVKQGLLEFCYLGREMHYNKPQEKK